MNLHKPITYFQLLSFIWMFAAGYVLFQAGNSTVRYEQEDARTKVIQSLPDVKVQCSNGGLYTVGYGAGNPTADQIKAFNKEMEAVGAGQKKCEDILKTFNYHSFYNDDGQAVVEIDPK